MTRYRIVWEETWSRQGDFEVDEDCLREFAKIPIGPVPELAICTYLEEEVWMSPGDSWHPNSRPGQRPDDSVSSLDVVILREPDEGET